MASSARVVFVTVARGPLANRLARSIVAARLAACVNILSGVVSHYRWKGRAQRGAEALLMIKTTQAKLKALERWIVKNHPYETPEFLVLAAAGGSRAYLRWLEEAVR